ncbi:unnamed protein product, partial [Polarella glacialis]
VRRLVRGAMAAEIGSLVDQFGRSFQAADLGLSKMASGLLATQSVVNEVETATNSKLANFRGAVAKDMQTLQGQLLGLSHRLTALHGLVRQLAPSQSAYRQAVFEEIYEANRWGAAGGGSGGGSDLGATEPLRVGLLEAIAEHSIGLVVDAGCGSLAWVPDLLAAAEARGHRPAYCGADIARPLVESHARQASDASRTDMRFVVADLTETEGWQQLVDTCGGEKPL